MTIAFRASGTQSGATAPVTAVAPTLPSGILGGDITILSVAVKPYNATITTPAGWTKMGEWTNGSTAPGSETGSVKLAVYYQIGAQTAGVMPAIGQTSASSMVANTASYSTTGGSWDVSYGQVASTNTDTTAYSVTGGVIPLTTGDMLLAMTALDAAGGTRSAASFTTTGVTQFDHQGRTGGTCTTGLHSALYWRDVHISAGTASVAPVFSFTNTSALSGMTLLLRLREAGLALTASASETVGVTETRGTADTVQAATAETVGATDTPSPQVKDDVDVVGEVVGITDTAATSLATSGASSPVAITATLSASSITAASTIPVAVAAAHTAAGVTGAVAGAAPTVVVSSRTAAGAKGVTSPAASTALTAGAAAVGFAGLASTAAPVPLTAARVAAATLGFRNTTAQTVLTAATSASGTAGATLVSTTAVAAARPAVGATGFTGVGTTSVAASLTASGAVQRTSTAVAVGVVDVATATANIALYDGRVLGVAAGFVAVGSVGEASMLGADTPVAVGFVAAGSAGLSVPGSAVAITATRTTVGSVPRSGVATTAVTVSGSTVGARPVAAASLPLPVTAVITATDSWGSGIGMSTPTALVAAISGAGSVSVGSGSSALSVVGARTAAGSIPGTGASSITVTAACTAAAVVGTVLAATDLVVSAARTGVVLLSTAPTAVPTAVNVTRIAAGLVQYQLSATPVIRARFAARGISQRLPTSLVTDLWYQSLPAVYRAVDHDDTSSRTGRPLYWFLDSLTSPLDLPMRIATRIRNGELTDANLADDEWIPWLAQAVGVSGNSVPELRARLLALQAAPALASTAYLTALIKPMLTGTQFVQIYPNPPWTITVAVNAGELGNVGGTTDGLATTVYATGRVPTGYLLAVTSAAVQTWAQIDAVTSTWADVAGDSWKTVDTAGL